jgi:hypothetical protein
MHFPFADFEDHPANRVLGLVGSTDASHLDDVQGPAAKAAALHGVSSGA